MNKFIVVATSILALSAASAFAQPNTDNQTVFGFRNVAPAPALVQPPSDPGQTVFGFRFHQPSQSLDQPMIDMAETSSKTRRAG